MRTIDQSESSTTTTDLLHRVVHRHQRLQPLPVQEVGELHVNGSHGPGVLHDPVFVHIWGVVVAGSAVDRKKGKRETTCLKQNKVEHIVYVVYTVLFQRKEKITPVCHFSLSCC